MSALSDKILDIATDYLGIGAKRFLDRQAAHLKVSSFDLLEPEQLEKFIRWVDLSAKLILDEQRAAEFARRMDDLLVSAKAPPFTNYERLSE